MSEIRQCVKCGLLAIRNVEDSHVYAADELVRKGGVLPMRQLPGTREPHRGVSLIHRSDTLICYVGRPEMRCPPETAHCLPFIIVEHHCPKFVPWLPGKSPKEHEDMTILEQVRTEQAIFQMEEKREREKQRAEDLADRNAQQAHNKTTRRVAVGSLIVAIAVACAALWNAFGKRQTDVPKSSVEPPSSQEKSPRPQPAILPAAPAK